MADAGRPRRRLWRRPASRRTRLLIDAALALVVVGALVGFVGVVFTVRVFGSSMEPTVRDGDSLLFDPLTYHLRAPERGEIAVVTQPNGVQAVKRVIGVPGDLLEIDGGWVDPTGPRSTPRAAVLVKPGGTGAWQRLVEPYVVGSWTAAVNCCDARGLATQSPTPVAIPADSFFVLGDNRNASRDSRDFGFLPRDHVNARVLLRYWPIGSFGRLASGTALAPAGLVVLSRRKRPQVRRETESRGRHSRDAAA